MYAKWWLVIYLLWRPCNLLCIYHRWASKFCSCSWRKQCQQKLWPNINSRSLWFVVQVTDLGTFQSTTGSDCIHFEHWNLIWMACVNLMEHSPSRHFISEVKHTLWGHRLQIYYLNFSWQPPILGASKHGCTEKCILMVWLDYDQEICLWGESQGGGWKEYGCVNMPPAPRTHCTITYGKSCISIYTGG